MSEFPKYSDDSVVESLFYAYGRDFLARRKQLYQQMLAENRVGSEGAMPWLQQYHDNHTTPRLELAWLLASRSFYSTVTTEELLGDTPPMVRMVYVPYGEDRMHAVDLSVAAVNPQLYQDLALFTARKPFVVDEEQFKKDIVTSYGKHVTQFGIRHAEAGLAYDDQVNPDNTFMKYGELFTFIPEDDFTFSGGTYDELPQEAPVQFMDMLANAELESLRAEAIAASLQHAWRIGGPQTDSYDPLERLLSA